MTDDVIFLEVVGVMASVPELTGTYACWSTRCKYQNGNVELRLQLSTLALSSIHQ